MNKWVVAVIFGGIVSLISPLTLADQQGLDDSRAVVDQYFSALQQGNGIVLLSLFGPKERERTDHLWPASYDGTYGAWLADRYRNAWLEILEVKDADANYIYEIALHLNQTESVRETLILQRSNGGTFRIVQRYP